MTHGKYEDLVAAARKFIMKVENGMAHSIVTYSELKAALAKVESNGQS